jgi:hypothetical protein
MSDANDTSGMSDMRALISLHQVSLKLGGVQALQEVSLN